MGFADAWVETDPDGTVITVSLLDDSDRLIKRALRARLEGDPASPDLTGLIEVGSFAAAPKPRKGTARGYVDTLANILAFDATKREDGRIGIATDRPKLYHVATAGVVEVAPMVPPVSGGWASGVGPHATIYQNPWSDAGIITTGETDSAVPVPRACYLSRLYVKTRTSQSVSGNLVLTIMVNGVATAVTVTIAAGAAALTLGTDLTHSVALAAGDLVSMRLANSAASPSATLRWSFILEN